MGVSFFRRLERETAQGGWMKVALAQVNTTVGDVLGNRDLVLRTLAEAEARGADLALFPELCLTGYPPRDLLALHGFVEANIRALHDIATRAGRTAAVVGFVDRNSSGQGKAHYNAAGFLCDGKVQSVIRKTLLPTYDVFDEDRYFERGEDTQVVPFRGRKLGISICEDCWNDEDFWPKRLYRTDPIRNLVRAGADLLINISASPFESEKTDLRHRMLLSHVRKHRVPLLYLNLVGGNDDLLFDGNSLALANDGRVLAQGRSFEEELILVDPDGAGNLEYRKDDQVADLFKALVTGTRDYGRKCGFKTAVLGLSGGIDSAVTACVAADAFGRGNVTGVSMPSVYSARESHDDARDLARHLGIEFRVIPIQPIFSEYRTAFAEVFRGLPEDSTEENLQARIRGNILMALSNKFGHLVLSTGNKSELGVGYCTLYGDMAGGLAVISDIPKTTVYKLAVHINREREIIPANTLVRAPTAELRHNQTDQDTLPEYEVLDPILRLSVEEHMSIAEIAERGYEESVVREVVRMIHSNEYKRRQAAPGLKVSTRAFGTGRRMPIAKRLNF